MHKLNLIRSGLDAKEADKALIMVHGRGGRAEDFLGLADQLELEGFAIRAPQANNNTWYPYSFMAPISQNEPFLTSALEMLKEVVDNLISLGITEDRIYFAGFSQGACLTLEYVARNAKRYGGVVAFTGGLVGDQIYESKYSGDFQQTPIFIGTGDPDPHVPVERIYASVKMLEGLGASVTTKVYPGRPHTISTDELNLVNQLIFSVR